MRRSERKTASRIRLAPILLVAFVVVPLAEIAVLIRVGSWIGLLPTLALIILTAVIGTWMLRRQGFAVLARAQRQLEQGVMPVAEVFEGLCLLVAGGLLLTPGFITDVCGALLLLPPVRAFLYRHVGHYLERHVVRAPGAPPAGRPPGRVPPVVEGEYQEVAPDDADDLPPPRGSWDEKQ
jgi:UPF0716 protein FxsA